MTMTLSGQWVTAYTGSNTGTLVLDIDEVGDHYEGTAIGWDNIPILPNALVRFRTISKTVIQKLRNIQLVPLDNFGNLIPPKMLEAAKAANTFQVPQTIDVDIELKGANLEVSWKTNMGTIGNATAPVPKTRAGLPSELKPHRINSWERFKDYVNKLERRRYIFRGQENDLWRLRTSFFRAGRASLDRYDRQDVRNDINKLVAGSLQHTIDLNNPQHFLAALHLAQHHGYPTPLLDWTWSPYVAAFFAFRNIRTKKLLNSRKKIRIFKFDTVGWGELPRANKIFPYSPHVTLLDPLAIENNRAIPQQSLSAFSNLDDIETHIQQIENIRSKTFLEVFEFPMRDRNHIMHELALMGITAGSLFPGLDGAFESLREQNFT